MNNREGFLRYILLLLGDYTGGFLNKGGLFNTGNGFGSWTEGFTNGVPILEELARAFSRSPDKLKDVKAVVNRLMRDEDSKSIVPKEFIELWNVFEIAMEEADK